MALVLRDIHKTFGETHANDGVNLTLEGGTIHGLLGENGAGKSTLMKILSGYQGADSGEMSLDGSRLRLSSPRDAIAAGIGMLHQDPLVFLPFTVLDNFLLGSPGRHDRATGLAGLAEARERFGFHLDPDAPARALTVGERQQLEIARLLHLQAKVLILDEPTTGISADQRTTLFAALRALAAGGMTVIFVSHKLEEVADICSEVAVMRRGRVVGATSMPCPADELVEMMFGKVFAAPEPVSVELGATELCLDGMTVSDRGIATRDLSLAVRAGEVIGLAGLEGSGQRTFLRACAGLLRPDCGRLEVGGQDLAGHPYRDFRAAGVYFMPAGRLEEGLLSGFSITEHVQLALGGGGFVVDWASARAEAERRIRDFSIKGDPSTTADALSGGNQQRLLLALMPDNVRLLLMEHPTRGLDIESADWVWTQLMARRKQGTAIVFSSADLDELLRYSDRIIVFFAGQVLEVLDTRATSGEALGRLIGGMREVAA
ncbi:MAG TPA: ATP-binding cassette domain-containing protein [Acidimicrobiales bacterium]|nr:ATP-binding cassette domain-containing protein [Acidimicrobiales bacterium]